MARQDLLEHRQRLLVSAARFAEKSRAGQLRAPQQMGHERALFEGPQVVIEDLTAALVSHPHHHPPSFHTQLCQDAGELARPFRRGQGVQLEQRFHGWQV